LFQSEEWVRLSSNIKKQKHRSSFSCSEFSTVGVIRIQYLYVRQKLTPGGVLGQTSTNVIPNLVLMFKKCTK
jgi:hypothetical protein